MILEKLFNIHQQVINKDISIARALMIFYLMIGSNYMGNLYSHQLKDFINHNRTAQHVIGFTMLLVIINLFAGVSNIKDALVYSTVIYLWFIFTTKLDLHWNLAIIGMLAIGYVKESSMINKEGELYDDENVPDDIENKVTTHNKDIRSYLVLGIVMVTAIGTWQYYNKKTGQFGGGFDPVKYMFCAAGSQKCCHQCGRL